VSACVGVPVSWLRLERHALGEVDGEVAAHVAACAACRAALATIEADDRPLPPLPVPAAPRRRWSWWPRLAFAGGLVAAAAALILWVVIRRGEEPAMHAGSRVRVKGGELVVSLVRERGGAVTFEPSRFAPGDRFKVRVTCSPGAAGDVAVDVVVFQDGAAAWPLAPARLACGNLVAVPGAFRITGAGPARICLAVAERGAVDRAAIEARGARGAEVGCVGVEPER
jgi:hypothetical protein